MTVTAPSPSRTGPADASRRGMLARVAATAVAAAAASVLGAKRASAHGPGLCSGDNCWHHCIYNCPGSPIGKCCWVVIDEYRCRTYRCCDYDGYACRCTCRHFIGNFC